ncbi:MAG: ribonuclease HII [Duncaniella sp.]|nr:ribonuclease HII [Duncaniella sp.]
MLPSCLTSFVLEAGCDEAGRGCLAGPVCAAAVILPDGFTHPLLNDSKKLSEARREQLRPVIESEAVAWAVAWASAQEIDEMNILNASILAMHRALDLLSVRPGEIVVDGNRFKPYGDIPYRTIVKGDGKLGNIAAASILAKTHRDELMVRVAREYPGYGWEINKGYPTAAHRQAISSLGLTPYHRSTFKWQGE